MYLERYLLLLGGKNSGFWALSLIPPRKVFGVKLGGFLGVLGEFPRVGARGFSPPPNYPRINPRMDPRAYIMPLLLFGVLKPTN